MAFNLKQKATITSIDDDSGIIQGAVADGGFTDDTSPSLSGSLSASLASGETVRIYDGATYLGDARVSGTTWTFADPRTLADGQSVSYTVRITDAALNEGTYSAPYSATVLLNQAPPRIGIQPVSQAAGEETRVNTSTYSYQVCSKNAGLSDGGYVTVWASQQYDTRDVYGQRFDSFGRPVGDEFRVNTYTRGWQGNWCVNGALWDANLDVAALRDGGFVVTWCSGDQDGSWGGIYGQRYDGNGARVGGEFRVNSTTVGNQQVPQIAGLDDGGYVIVWASADQDGSEHGVYGQRYDSNGTRAGGEFRVNVTTAYDQGSSWGVNQEGLSVAGLKNGGFVVTWFSDNSSNAADDSWARIYKADNTPLTGEFRVNTHTAGTQWLPQVTDLSDGGFLVSWVSRDQVSSNSGNDIFAQRFDSNGAKVGAEFLVNTFTAGDQGTCNLESTIRMQDVAGLKNGGWVAVWNSEGQDGSGGGVYYQVFDAIGARVGSETRANILTRDFQGRPSVTALGDGGFTISWDSDRQKDYDDQTVRDVYQRSTRPTAWSGQRRSGVTSTPTPIPLAPRRDRWRNPWPTAAT